VYFTISLILVATLAEGATLLVGQNLQYKTIQGAVAAANDGDSIMVHNGYYREGNILIDKSICLIGVEYPELDGEKVNEIITIQANDVLVYGFIFRNSGHMSTKDIALFIRYRIVHRHVQRHFRIYIR
jgi:nitrous oxidase accessory protein